MIQSIVYSLPAEFRDGLQFDRRQNSPRVRIESASCRLKKKLPMIVLMRLPLMLYRVVLYYRVKTNIENCLAELQLTRRYLGPNFATLLLLAVSDVLPGVAAYSY